MPDCSKLIPHNTPQKDQNKYSVRINAADNAPYSSAHTPGPLSRAGGDCLNSAGGRRHGKLPFFLTSLALAGVILSAPLHAGEPETLDPANHNNLSGTWLRSTDDGHTWSEVQVPFLERDFVGTMIITRDISLPADCTGDMLLLAGRIDDGDSAAVNGQKVGSMPGSWDERRGYEVNYFRDRVYRVPAQILRPGKSNTIEITIYNYSGFGGITGRNIALINDATFFDNILPELLELPRRHELLYYVLIGLFIAFALISVLNFAYFREDKSDLYLFIVLINFIIFTCGRRTGQLKNPN
jgi:hypothetical protein